MEKGMSMNYDFDKTINRRGMDSLKWNVGKDELPMWVADMDFQTAPEVMEAMRERLEHGVFGYTEVTDEWYNAYIGWWRDRHGFEMSRDWLIFCTGVIPSISSMVRKLATPNENVLIQTPVYNGFFGCIKNNGCRVLENPLVYENGSYSMDFEDLEKKLADPQTSLMILCNPHNPIGKIWDRDTLKHVGELAYKHHVTVISDEIHCDITEPGKEYVPFAAISDICRDISATCITPTKTFNLAGIHTAAVSVPDPYLRHKVWRALNTDEIAEPGCFATVAAISAFEKGADWLNELCAYVSENKKTAASYMKKEIPGIFAVESDATYLLWIDVSALPGDSSEIAGHIRESSGLYLSTGAVYGDAGKHFLRMNLACPKTICKEGLERLKKGIDTIIR